MSEWANVVVLKKDLSLPTIAYDASLISTADKFVQVSEHRFERFVGTQKSVEYALVPLLER